MDLTSFGMVKIQVFLLVLFRTAGIFTLTPVFGSARIPMQVRVALAVAMSLVFVTIAAPTITKAPATDILTMVMLVARESIVGMVIGFAVMLVFGAIQIAGDYIDMTSGFSAAQIFDPINGTHTAIAGQFHNMLACMLFFVTNAHHILIGGLADSFRILPVGVATLSPAVTGGALDLFAAMFGIAIRIAAPVVAAVFVADLALVLISKAVPQMNVLMVGLPVKLGVGIVGMLVALPVSVALSRDVLGNVGHEMNALLKLLT